MIQREKVIRHFSSFATKTKKEKKKHLNTDYTG